MRSAGRGWPRSRTSIRRFIVSTTPIWPRSRLNEDVTLLSYSPLAAGLLTGNTPRARCPRAAARRSTRPPAGRQPGWAQDDRGVAAAEAYGRLAAEHGWDVVHMVIAWQLTRPFKVVPIIGATTMDQLRHLIAGLDRDLPDELRRGIERCTAPTRCPIDVNPTVSILPTGRNEHEGPGMAGDPYAALGVSRSASAMRSRRPIGASRRPITRT